MVAPHPPTEPKRCEVPTLKATARPWPPRGHCQVQGVDLRRQMPTSPSWTPQTLGPRLFFVFMCLCLLFMFCFFRQTRTEPSLYRTWWVRRRKPRTIEVACLFESTASRLISCFLTLGTKIFGQATWGCLTVCRMTLRWLTNAREFLFWFRSAKGPNLDLSRSCLGDAGKGP